MRFLLELHPLISFTIVTGFSVLVGLLGLACVRKRYPLEHLKGHHEVGGIIFNAFGVIYAVLVAFVVFAAWSSYDGTNKNLELEVNKLASLFMDAGAFKEPMKRHVQETVASYAQSAVDLEWPTLAKGARSADEICEKLDAIWRAYVDVEMDQVRNPQMYQEALQQLNAMAEFRRLRVFASREHTPMVIWIVLIAGGLISVAYILFFGMERQRAQKFMISVYTTMNSMVLYLIFVLDHPFVGYNAISNDPFKAVLRGFLRRLGQ
jgi:hypothetical protein